MSGFNGQIEAKITELQSKNNFFVSCYFKKMLIQTAKKEINNKEIWIVDLGGIIHVVLEDDFPKNSYQEIHNKITQELNLQNRKAVGVIWIKKINTQKIIMHPVVWVNEINSFFYESSCGSGSIAVSKITNCSEIVQPSGEKITALIDKQNNVVLESEMEVIYEYQNNSS